MNLKGIEVNLKHQAPLEKGYIPIKKWNDAYLAEAKKPLKVAIRRQGDHVAVFDTFIRGDEASREADILYVGKLVKMMLWARGGYQIYICGDDEVAKEVAADYTAEGARAFDYDFMENVYDRPLEFVSLPYDECPEENEASEAIGKHLNGCRIGFDAGGSDRKVSAVIDGETVYSEEVVWFPKITPDPDYHFNGIVEAMETAKSKMPRVDGIGVSSAGIYIDNEARVASLFLAVPEEDFKAKVVDIYKRAAETVAPGKPLIVANDGDVSALAGAMSLDTGNIMGIAMGTSEAVGFVDENQNIAGWLNELAFAPVDLQEEATQDEWSGDFGVGCKYFSQDAAIRLAEDVGLEIDHENPLAEKLKEIQAFMEKDDPRAQAIYESIGVYLGHTLAYYKDFYDIKHLILMGRVVSGKGGDLILKTAREVLAEEYPDIKDVELMLPNEEMRRVGQSMAAASLPFIAE